MRKAVVAVVNPFMFDPFSLFQLPPIFALDLDALHRRYGQLQLLCHPDKHHNPLDRQVFMEKSMEITRAYDILKDPLKRALWLLKDRDSQESYEDPQVLIEVMELKEAIALGQLSSRDIDLLQAKAFEALCKAFEEKQFDEAQNACYRYQFLCKLKVPSHAFATS
jgi:Fe-S protein assembly co-chaperone HscB